MMVEKARHYGGIEAFVISNEQRSFPPVRTKGGPICRDIGYVEPASLWHGSLKLKETLEHTYRWMLL